VLRGVAALEFERPLVWESAPTGAPPQASLYFKALADLEPGWRFIMDGVEIARIGVAGYAVPFIHYDIDDASYPAKIRAHGAVYEDWLTAMLPLARDQGWGVMPPASAA
jgi:hypothetical protein